VKPWTWRGLSGANRRVARYASAVGHWWSLLPRRGSPQTYPEPHGLRILSSAQVIVQGASGEAEVEVTVRQPEATVGDLSTATLSTETARPRGTRRW
jgi:anti-sigma factor RsiW